MGVKDTVNDNVVQEGMVAVTTGKDTELSMGDDTVIFPFLGAERHRPTGVRIFGSKTLHVQNRTVSVRNTRRGREVGRVLRLGTPTV